MWFYAVIILKVSLVMLNHSHPGSYRNYLRGQYGANVPKILNSILDFNAKLANQRRQLAFLHRCKHQHVLPHGFQIKNIWSNDQWTNGLLRTMGRKLLCHEIRSKYSKIDFICSRLRTLWSLLDNLSDSDSNRFHELARSKYRETAYSANQRHHSKFHRLTNPIWPNKEFRDSLIINRSTVEFNDNERDILALDPKFVVPPTKAPVADVVACVESALRTLPTENADRTVRACTTALRKSTRTSSNNRNLSDSIKSVHKKLKDNDLMLVKADKGNKTVVFPCNEYLTKVETHLKNDNIYEIVPEKRNPITSTRAKLYEKLRPIKRENKDFKLYNLVPTPDTCELPKPYGLAKVHKPEMPLRIITPTHSFPTYKIAKLLHNLFLPFVNRIKHRISSASVFIEEIRALKLPSNSFICSFDVVSLFDNIDIDRFMVLCADFIKERSTWLPYAPLLASLKDDELIDLVKFVLSNSYARFNNVTYRQRYGVPMGSPISVAVSELFMDFIECTALNSCDPTIRPKFYRRFLDDSFLVFAGDMHTAKLFLQHLNSINNRVRFTVEMESNCKLPFLDILIHRNNDCLTCSVYQKPTHSNRYAHPSSCVPNSVLASVIRSLRYRAQLYCIDTELLTIEKNRINLALKNNGYTDSFLQKYLWLPQHNPMPLTNTNNTIFLPYYGKDTYELKRYFESLNLQVRFKHLPSIRDKLYYKMSGATNDSNEKRNVVYELKCKTCGNTYIGETTRTLKTRLREHESDASSSKADNLITGASLHLRTTGHSGFESRILDRDRSKMGLKVREALNIRAKKPILNGNDGGYEINPLWTDIYSQIVP